MGGFQFSHGKMYGIVAHTMITKEEVQHIAKLARIQLSREQVEKFQKELSQVLDYFTILQEVDVLSVEPLTHSIEVKNVLREDEPRKADPEVVQKLLGMAPEQKDGFLKVKSVF